MRTILEKKIKGPLIGGLALLASIGCNTNHGRTLSNYTLQPRLNYNESEINKISDENKTQLQPKILLQAGRYKGEKICNSTLKIRDVPVASDSESKTAELIIGDSGLPSESEGEGNYNEGKHQVTLHNTLPTITADSLIVLSDVSVSYDYQESGLGFLNMKGALKEVYNQREDGTISSDYILILKNAERFVNREGVDFEENSIRTETSCKGVFHKPR